MNAANGDGTTTPPKSNITALVVFDLWWAITEEACAWYRSVVNTNVYCTQGYQLSESATRHPTHNKEKSENKSQNQSREEKNQILATIS